MIEIKILKFFENGGDSSLILLSLLASIQKSMLFVKFFEIFSSFSDPLLAYKQYVRDYKDVRMSHQGSLNGRGGRGYKDSLEQFQEEHSRQQQQQGYPPMGEDELSLKHSYQKFHGIDDQKDK